VGVPVSREWTFDGATPATSGETNPEQITYPAEGEFAVKLKVKNLAQIEDEAEIADYVKAGYDTPDKIWNLLPGDNGQTVLTSGPAYVTGTNSFGDVAFADRFDAPLATGYLSEVGVKFFKSASASGTLTVSVQKGKGEEPGQVLTTKALDVSSISDTDYTWITFDAPAYTDGAFFVVVSGFDNLTSGEVAINSSAILPANYKNTAYVLDASDTWLPVLESWGSANALSLNVAPVFTYFKPTFDVAGDFSVKRKDIDATVATVEVTSTIPWEATSSANWITIVNGSANADGEFTYTVADNTGLYPRAAKIIVAPVGIESLQKVITIYQASTYPVGLTADFEGEDVRVDWDEMVAASARENTLLNAASQKNTKVANRKSRLSDDELAALIPNHFGSKTAIRTSSRSKFDQLTVVDEAGVAVRGNSAKAESKNASIAKSSLRSTPVENIIRWDTGNNLDAIGISSPQLTNYKLEVASYFPVSDLVANIRSGISSIKKLEVYINDLPIDGITLKIRQGNVVYKQKVENAALTSASFNTLSLNESFVIDKHSDLYIGYEFAINGGMYVAGIDEGPAVVGKGDLLSEQNGPLFSLYEATGGSLSGNWNIAAVVETGKLSHYLVYRDDAQIAQVENPTHLDTDDLSFGLHYYEVTAVYSDAIYGDLESSRSDTACVLKTSPATDLFDLPIGPLTFNANGSGNKIVTVTINDPEDYITQLGLSFFVNAPSWISYTLVGNVLTFTADPNTTGAARTGVIQVWLGASGSSFDASSGYEIVINQKALFNTDMLNYSLAAVLYNGMPQGPIVSAKPNTGLAAITVKYNNSTEVPIDAGAYTVSVDIAGNSNFEAMSGVILGNFMIYRAAITIQPNNASRLYGVSNPNFTLNITGLVGRDTPASLGAIVITTTATTASLPGNYPITARGAQNLNYNIGYQSGTLTVNQLSQTISFQEITSKRIGDSFQAGAVSSSGLSIRYSSSDPSIAEVAEDGTVTAKAIGTVSITASQEGNAIYESAASVTRQFVVEDGTAIDNVFANSITVYPNPVSKSTPVYVLADVDESLLNDAVIAVYNASGSLVKHVEVTGKQTEVKLPAASGTYILQLKGKTGVLKNLKVVVK
jgi:hypothetical protein